MISGPAIKATTPFHRMEAALCETGREDIAACLERDRIDDPKIGGIARLFPDDTEVIARAAMLAHSDTFTTEDRSWCWRSWQEMAAALRGDRCE